jgi:hypothetical protein
VVVGGRRGYSHVKRAPAAKEETELKLPAASVFRIAEVDSLILETVPLSIRNSQLAKYLRPPLLAETRLSHPRLDSRAPTT